MATIRADGATLTYEVAGESGTPALVFIPDIAFGPWMWGWQAPALAGPYRTIVYATRGTNGSDRSGPYTVDRLAADVEAVLADVGVRRVHVIGAGLGGMVALRYVREYGRARSISVFGAAKSGDQIDRTALSALYPSSLEADALEASLSSAFSQRFLAERDRVEQIVAWRREEDATGEALSGHQTAALEFDAGPLVELSLPTLVCHGVDDPIVPIEAGEALAGGLPRGRFEPVEGKRCCYIEHATAVTDAIDGFVRDVDATIK